MKTNGKKFGVCIYYFYVVLINLCDTSIDTNSAKDTMQKNQVNYFHKLVPQFKKYMRPSVRPENKIVLQIYGRGLVGHFKFF